MPMAATSMGTRKVPRWNSAPAGRREAGLRPATGDQASAGGQEEDAELHGCRGWRPMDRYEHRGGRQEEEGPGAGHPDGAGARRIGTAGSGRDGALVAVMPPPSADIGPGGPGVTP
jgi:hypothetical protein